MKIGMYLLIAYLAIINIVTLTMYVQEARHPSRRLSAFFLILFPILGGAAGAVLANYFSDTEYRELRSQLSKFLGFLPPIMFILQFIVFVTVIGVDNCVTFVWNSAYEKVGVVGYIWVVVNVLSFFFVIIRKSSYYIAPIGNFLIPDFILIPILLFGGATGGVVAKLLFNFKEHWSCNCTMKFQNFLYNWGMFLVAALHIGIYVGFYFIR